MTHKPRIGDKLNDKSRGPYRANGYIAKIHWRDEEVTVKFYTRNHYNGNDQYANWEYSEYSFDQLDFCWDEVFDYYVIPATEVSVNWLEGFITKLKEERCRHQSATLRSTVVCTVKNVQGIIRGNGR